MNIYKFGHMYEIIYGWCSSDKCSDIELVYDVWNETLLVQDYYRTFNKFKKVSMSNLKKLVSMLKKEDDLRTLQKIVIYFK